MANYNKVLLMGNLTRDPELRHTPANTAVANIGLAVNRRFRTQDGQDREETTFVDCEAWGRTAEVMAQYLAKGRPVFVEGRLKLDQWQDKDGSNRSKLKVVIEGFQFVDSKGGGGGAGGDSGGGGGYAPRQSAPSQQRGGQSDYNNPPVHEPIGEEDIPF